MKRINIRAYQLPGFLPETQYVSSMIYLKSLSLPEVREANKGLSKSFSRLAMFMVGVAMAVLVLGLGPQVWGKIKTLEASSILQVLTRPGKTFGEELVDFGDKKPEEMWQPPFDPTLPAENRLIVSEIKIDTNVGENTLENVEETLRKGVWRVPNFGTPWARKRPMILAAHRFGYLEWSNTYRRENSFFNLPKLEDGDRVEIVWNQRNYVYEIYGDSEGGDITDYKADLILYTCRFLDSDTRIFRYAKLLEG